MLHKILSRTIVPPNITWGGGIHREKIVSKPANGQCGPIAPLIPSQVFCRMAATLGEITFNPIHLDLLASMKLAADTVFGVFGLEVVDIAEHVYVDPTKAAGDITRLNGEIAPRLLAADAAGSIGVALNGPETGTTINYKKVKTRTDGMGADAAFRALSEFGNWALPAGYYAVMVSTEGTPSHPKPDEPATGNPTVNRGMVFPSQRRILAEGFEETKFNQIPAYDGLRAICLGIDVIECTEAAATSPAAYETIAGHPKDIGACSVLQVADNFAPAEDLYADKFAIAPWLMKIIRERGEILRLDPNGDTIANLTEVSRASGLSFDQLGVIGLGLKLRYKIDPVTGQRIEGSEKCDREGRRELLDSITRLKIHLKTIDDGETPGFRPLIVGSPIEFNDGWEGRAGVFFGCGGVFESSTLARAVQDAGGEGWFFYVNKDKTKKVATYEQRRQMSSKDIDALAKIGETEPSRPRNIRELVGDEGDRMLIVTTFMDNPLNPQAMPVQVDEESGTITFYQEVFASDGSMRGLVWTLKAKKELSAVKAAFSPVIPDLMEEKKPDLIVRKLEEIRKTPEGLAAIRSGLMTYLYYYVSENPNPKSAGDFVIDPERLRGRMLLSDERRDIAVLLWAAKTYPQWFTLQMSISDAMVQVLAGLDREDVKYRQALLFLAKTAGIEMTSYLRYILRIIPRTEYIKEDLNAVAIQLGREPNITAEELVLPERVEMPTFLQDLLKRIQDRE